MADDGDLQRLRDVIHDADQTLRGIGVPNHTDTPIEGRT
jgi:hypothetical protein